MQRYNWIYRDKIKTFKSVIPEIMDVDGVKQLCSAVLMQAIKDNCKEFFELEENIYCDYLDITYDMVDFENTYINYLKSKTARKPNRANEEKKRMASVLQKEIEIELRNDTPICVIAKKFNISQQRVYYYSKKIKDESYGTN